jgi:hypothetical protein
MSEFLQTQLFKLGTAAMGAASLALIVLFTYALNAPTQPVGPRWRMTVIAAEDVSNAIGAKPARLGADSDVH